MKRIAYDYLFNYFGGDTHMGKIVVGASITLNIRVYKDGREVLFEKKEPVAEGRPLSDVYKVRYDKEKLFIIEKNLYIDNLFRLCFGWDKIEAEPVGYSFDVVIGTMKDIKELNNPEILDEIGNLPVSEPVEVSEQEFLLFLKAHENDFDITDNKSAQVPSVTFMSVKKDEL